MIQTNFSQWITDHPFISERLLAEGPEWSRLICKWNENQGDREIQHSYAVVIDMANGDFYLDCSPQKIRAKCLGLAFAYPLAYPLALTIHTLYLACFPLSIPVAIISEIWQGIGKDESYKEIAKRSLKQVVKQLADGVRSPLYAVALTTICLASVLISLIRPDKLYDLRKLIGRIDLSLNWNDPDDCYADCFQPIANLKTIENYARIYDDTIYENNSVLIGMANQVRFSNRAFSQYIL